MNNITEDEIRKTIEELDKLGWVYNGFDASEYAESFTRINKPFRYLIHINNRDISFDCIRTDTNKFPFEQVPFRFFAELPQFYKLYEYMKNTRKGLPKDLAKNQKDLDNTFKFLTGETYCSFE